METASNDAGTQPADKHAFVRVWHPRHPLQVSVPIPIAAGFSREDADRLLASVDNLLAAGWLPNEATLAEGEHVETVQYVVLREHCGANNVITPLVDLYGEDQKYPCLSVYLNNDLEILDFEQVSGLKIRAMQPYVGEGRIERGKNPRLDMLVFKAANSFRVVHVPNPKHDPSETDVKKKKPKRLFNRWADLPAKQPPEHGEQPATKPQQNLPTSAASNSQREAGKKAWKDCTDEEKREVIMGMTDMMRLLEAKSWADKLPMDQAHFFTSAVRDRAFQMFQLNMSSATSESAIKDIVDAATTGNFGKMTDQQMRDLQRLATDKRHYLNSTR